MDSPKKESGQKKKVGLHQTLSSVSQTLRPYLCFQVLYFSSAPQRPRVTPSFLGDSGHVCGGRDILCDVLCHARTSFHAAACATATSDDVLRLKTILQDTNCDITVPVQLRILLI